MMPEGLLGSRSFCFKDADPKVEAAKPANKLLHVDRRSRRRHHENHRTRRHRLHHARRQDHPRLKSPARRQEAQMGPRSAAATGTAEKRRFL